MNNSLITALKQYYQQPNAKFTTNPRIEHIQQPFINIIDKLITTNNYPLILFGHSNEVSYQTYPKLRKLSHQYNNLKEPIRNDLQYAAQNAFYIKLDDNVIANGYISETNLTDFFITTTKLAVVLSSKLFDKHYHNKLLVIPHQDTYIYLWIKSTSNTLPDTLNQYLVDTAPSTKLKYYYKL